MKFLKAFKQAFNPDTEEDALYADTTSTQQPTAAGARRAVPTPAQPVSPGTPLDFDPEMQSVIFSKVVEVVDQSLPDFLGKAIDRKAQSQYLLEALDEGVRLYINALSAKAEQIIEARRESERAAVNSELEALRTRAEEVEKKSVEFQQKQLSADRQKRALSERVHDLEASVARLEAEKEQLELENRSMLNRVKASSVQQDDLDAAKAENEQLKSEIKQLKDNPESGNREQVEALQSQVSQINAALESAREESRIAKELVEEVRHAAAETQKQLNERDRQLAEANSQISQYSRELDKAMTEINAKLKENAARLEMQADIISKREAKIAELKAELAQKDAAPAAIQENADEPIVPVEIPVNDKPTDDKPNEPQSVAPVQPSEPIIRPAEQPKPLANPVDEITDMPKIDEDELSEIEDTFETLDWFGPTEEEPDAEPDDSLEIKPSRKRRRPSDDGQLSLF